VAGTASSPAHAEMVASPHPRWLTSFIVAGSATNPLTNASFTTSRFEDRNSPCGGRIGPCAQHQSAALFLVPQVVLRGAEAAGKSYRTQHFGHIGAISRHMAFVCICALPSCVNEWCLRQAAVLHVAVTALAVAYDG
jgi:hypothetical protein